MKRGFIRNDTSTKLIRWAPVWWAFTVFILGSFLIFQVNRGVVIETDILKLLPGDSLSPSLEKTIERFNDYTKRQLYISLTLPSQDKLSDAAGLFRTEIFKSDFFSHLPLLGNKTSQEDFFKTYFPYRFQILGPKTRSALTKNEPHKELILQAQKQLYLPFSSYDGNDLINDPLFFFADILSDLAFYNDSGVIHDGVLYRKNQGNHQAVLIFELKENPLDAKNQKNILITLERIKEKLIQDFPDLKINYSGFIKFAELAYREATDETAKLGLIALVGIVSLLIFSLRGLKPLLFSGLSLFTGILFATAVVMVVFERLHIITLVFGVGLTGICIDYSFHYFSVYLDQKDSWNSMKGLRIILPAISLGLITNIIGFSGFFASDFPGLKQIALFSAAGMAGAFLSVICLYPWAFRKTNKSNFPLIFINSIKVYLRFWEFLFRGKRSLPVLLILALFLTTGFYNLRFSEDFRLLQNFPDSLLKQDRELRKSTGNIDISRFVVVETEDEEQTLNKLEEVSRELSLMTQKGEINHYFSLSTLIPSRKSQLENLNKLQELYLRNKREFTKYFHQNGLSNRQIKDFENKLLEPNPRMLKPGDWINTEASKPFRKLWVQEKGKSISLILLGGIKNYAKIKALENMNGVHYVDQVSHITDLLKKYREDAIKLLFFAYLAIAVILFFRYGFKKTLLVMAPPVLSVALTLAVLSWLSIPINPLHIISSLLILGLGIDYSIFLAETSNQTERTLRAIFLSMLTTLLSFGLLFFSSIPALRTIGVTLFLGILFSWLLCPLAATKLDQNNKKC
ncbi:MAG: hypothetical protein OEY59_06150 [Deltaproteobacteria bacterium]|nr:hypothetical protein [Deltaproteobacteria bacterium]